MYAIEEYPTELEPSYYALCVGEKILEIVEGKTNLDPQRVLTRAERYSRDLFNNLFYFNVFRIPFLYSTNENEI